MCPPGPHYKLCMTMYLHRGVMDVPARSALLTIRMTMYLRRGVMGVPARSALLTTDDHVPAQRRDLCARQVCPIDYVRPCTCTEV